MKIAAIDKRDINGSTTQRVSGEETPKSSPHNHNSMPIRCHHA
jgi:hypothetical protein